MLFFDGTKGDIEGTVRMLKHKAEVKGMILTEYNEEEVMNGFIVMDSVNESISMRHIKPHLYEKV